MITLKNCHWAVVRGVCPWTSVPETSIYTASNQTDLSTSRNDKDSSFFFLQKTIQLSTQYKEINHSKSQMTTVQQYGTKRTCSNQTPCDIRVQLQYLKAQCNGFFLTWQNNPSSSPSPSHPGGLKSLVEMFTSLFLVFQRYKSLGKEIWRKIKHVDCTVNSYFWISQNE